MYKIAVLVSGNGSNLQAIIDTIAQKKWPIEIVLVASDKPEAYGIQRAKQAKLATEIVERADFVDNRHFCQQLQHTLQGYEPDLVVLAGFMRILSAEFVNHFQNRLINIHPSLLPKYKGLHTHRRALEARDQQHGISVHFVTEELDGGPIIAQMPLTIENNDTVETLAQRIHQLEHLLYPTVIHWLSEQRLLLTKDGVHFDQAPIAKQGMQITWDQLA